jgi:hypothetical protein
MPALLSPNRATAQAFMERLKGGVTLYTLWPDGGAPAPKTLPQALRANAHGFNVYFSLNIVRAGVNKKAAKDDIETIRAIAGDADWNRKAFHGRFGEGMQALGSTVLTALIKATSPQPSWIIFTGGGLQPIWLIKPLPNTPENQARAEAVGAYVADRFGGDGVQNVDRILRLPGTVNHPKTSKRDAGQPTALAEFRVVTDQVYRLEELEAAWGVDAASGARNKVVATIDRLPQLPELNELNDDLCGGMKERDASEALFTCKQIGPFLAGIPDGPFAVRERWENPLTGEKTDAGWRDWLWVMSGIADDDPSLEEDCYRLFVEVSEAAGGDTSQNEEQWRSTAGRKARRMAQGQQITTVATLIKLATELGWTGYALPTSATAALEPASSRKPPEAGVRGWTTAHEAAALKVAKSRLHDAFLIAQKLGGRRVRSSLVRVCMSVRSVPLRERLMFMLSALLLKSDHSPEEIVGAVEACGFPRETGVHAALWAKKNTKTGDPP